MAATDQQVQAFVNERVRPRCEQIRNLYLSCKDDVAEIGDVYAAVSQQSPTWSDNRTDGPPHLAAPNDVLAWNTFITGLIALVEGGSTGAMTAAAGQYPIVQKLCVRPFPG